MPNDYFQFKAFRIAQGDCAMKVTTDGCLFGALIELTGTERRILDIGTGTGLLSLMIAQRCATKIDAVEMDARAAEQARQNAQNSPWPDQIEVTHRSIQDFASARGSHYDLIICNPPFFKDHMRSGSHKDIAIHDDTLPQRDLVSCVNELSSDTAAFWVMYPEVEFRRMETLMKVEGWYLDTEISVFNRSGASIFRIIGRYVRGLGDRATRDLIIRREDGTYTDMFADLLRDYYL